VVVVYENGNGNGKGIWRERKERKKRGTRKWDDVRLVPINLLG
jgi:hypothetical protein